MLTLYIGNKNYSSWSLRAWVLMKAFGIAFHEQRITLYEADSPERIRVHSPSGRLPCLHDGSTIVWDTLSIAEYLAERHPGMWPADAGTRAWARSAAAEMHSGYSGLRNEFGMNLRIREKRKPSSAVATDIARIAALWREGRSRFGQGGDFLCGAFGIVDAFYCPVAYRFASYGVALDDVPAAYHQALLALPAMREWAAGASRETEHIPMLDRSIAQAQQQ
ncbi:MAG: glutathione S-transferase family protein [Betaproteobacteria bacterium]